MTDTFIEIIQFIKNPTAEKDPNTNFNYRLSKFGQVFAISLISSFALAILIGILVLSNLVSIEQHAMKDIMDSYSMPFVFFLAVVLAPILEESIFRAPLTLFKKQPSFKIALYTATLLFGFMHITNYEISLRILLFSPILVAPQIFLGFYLGFVRVRFGLLWAMALHACFNGLLMSFDFF
ncbi:MAG: CPBP family intramembrane metalloprotease [Polaribacter sp.]|nr:CPBP family intramembrane metalloprotease [Polaribacter sp.]